jgi:hypothetical protein
VDHLRQPDVRRVAQELLRLARRLGRLFLRLEWAVPGLLRECRAGGEEKQEDARPNHAG